MNKITPELLRSIRQLFNALDEDFIGVRWDGADLMALSPSHGGLIPRAFPTDSPPGLLFRSLEAYFAETCTAPFSTTWSNNGPRP